jgi:hypothetical protein
MLLNRYLKPDLLIIDVGDGTSSGRPENDGGSDSG